MASLQPIPFPHVAIELWTEMKPNWLRRHLHLAHCIPSWDAFGRIAGWFIDSEQVRSRLRR